MFAQINLKVYYPPPNKRLVWDYYNKLNIDDINLAIKSFNWKNNLMNFMISSISYLIQRRIQGVV